MDDNPYQSPGTDGARQHVSPPMRYVVMVFATALSAMLSACGGLMALSYPMNRGLLYVKVLAVTCSVGLALLCASAWHRRR